MCQRVTDRTRLESCHQSRGGKQCVVQSVRQCCPVTCAGDAVSHGIIQQQQLPGSEEGFD